MARELPKAHKGLTQDEIYKKVNLEWLQAFAVIIAKEDFPVFERLIENRVSAWKASLKDYERRQRSRAKRKSADDV